MISDRKIGIIADFARGKVGVAQLKNLIKYAFAKPRAIVRWEPIILEIFLTHRCNLKCDMCLTHSTKHPNLYGQKPVKDIDPETFRNILDIYKQALAVDFIGCGESLLNEDLFKMIEHASGVAKAYISLTTNGTLVGRYKERLLDSPLDFIYISINGYNAQDYARLTGMPGQYFKEIADNTAELMKLKGLRKKKMPQIWLSFITDNKNYLFLREMYGLAEHLGVDGMIILPFIPSPQEGFRPLERCLFSDTPGVLEEFRKIKKIGKGPQVKLSLRLLDKNMLSQGSKFKYCRAPFHTLTVDGEGNIGGCGCQLLDNSHNGKFWEKDAWNNPYFQQLRRRFLSSELPVLEPCTWCHNNSPHKV